MSEIDLDKLISKLDQASFTSFELNDGDFNLKVTKEATKMSGVSVPMPATMPADAQVNEVIDENIIEIKAPFVGVVYFTPSEGEDPYIKTGQQVAKGDTIALIEAMKMFNEVHATVAGEVVDILVENGSMVEFDQPIIRVRKN